MEVANEGLTNATMKESDLESLKIIDEYTLSEDRYKPDNLYYYNLLDDSEKKIYSEILYILDQRSEDIVLSSLDTDIIDKVFSYVQNDHPEIFYVEGFTYIKYMVADELKKISFSGKYTMDEDEINDYKLRVDGYVENFIEELNEKYPEGATDYQIIKYVYETIIENTDYELNSPQNQNVLSVMFYNKSVCQGYAKTVQLLLNRLGIECTMISGTGKEGELHAWNLVKADGDYYYVDATWGDASYNITADKEELINSVPPINYDFLLVTEEEILKKHSFDDMSILPECTENKDNYYVKEGLYFTEVDEEQIARAFEKAYENDLEYVTFKMDNENTYLKIWNYLLEEQNIFKYLKDMKSVSYAENNEDLYMVFWIK